MSQGISLEHNQTRTRWSYHDGLLQNFEHKLPQRYLLNLALRQKTMTGPNYPLNRLVFKNSLKELHAGINFCDLHINLDKPTLERKQPWPNSDIYPEDAGW